jgi:hypothetical protein
MASLKLRLNNATPEENRIATAIELLRRATLLQEAASSLLHPYTYYVIETNKEKREARQQLGKIAGEIIDIMAKELYKAGAHLYAQGLDLASTPRAVEVAEQAQKESQESREGTGDTTGNGGSVQDNQSSVENTVQNVQAPGATGGN